jgi:hypothetical protein
MPIDTPMDRQGDELNLVATGLGLEPAISGPRMRAIMLATKAQGNVDKAAPAQLQ